MLSDLGTNPSPLIPKIYFNFNTYLAFSPLFSSASRQNIKITNFQKDHRELELEPSLKIPRSPAQTLQSEAGARAVKGRGCPALHVAVRWGCQGHRPVSFTQERFSTGEKAGAGVFPCM